MNMRPIYIVLLILRVHFSNERSLPYYQPSQLHLSYPDDPTKMYVTWSTQDDPLSSVCEYGTKSLSHESVGYRTIFVDEGPDKRSQVIHRVTLTDLIPGKRYWYHCGGHLGWSELFVFRALDEGVSWSPRLIFFGDLGNVDGFAMPFLQQAGQLGEADAFFHVGDMAYDLDTENGLVGDQFMKQIQSFAGYAPYMVAVGNHEYTYNFSHYKNRFTMPHTKDNMFFSFNIGPAHFISISTEFYYFLNYGVEQMANQHHWLERDLIEANKPENRDIRPWIITYGHRPMYCSNIDEGLCLTVDNPVRVGIKEFNLGFENLFFKYGVDLAFWAHEHSFERTWPIYNFKVMNGSIEEPYTDPRATVHVTTGSAGSREHLDPFEKDQPYWSAFRSTDYGYTRMHVINATHLYLEQVSVEQAGKVIDSFTIVKNAHGSFAKLFPEDSYI